MKGVKDLKTGRFTKNIPIEKKCETCLKLYSPRHDAQKYCSMICFKKYASKLFSKKIVVDCKNCSTPLAFSPSRIKKHSNLFCNSQCYGIWMEKNQILNGEKNSNWNGGSTNKNTIIRSSAQYKRWRKSVFDRDNYTCQICKVRGGKLEADHIKPFAYFVESRFELSNGRTLCKECHKTTDTYMHKAKNYVKLQHTKS